MHIVFIIHEYKRGNRVIVSIFIRATEPFLPTGAFQHLLIRCKHDIVHDLRVPIEKQKGADREDYEQLNDNDHE